MRFRSERLGECPDAIGKWAFRGEISALLGHNTPHIQIEIWMRQVIELPPQVTQTEKAEDFSPAFSVCKPDACLQRLNVRCLPALRSLHHVELHGLAFLQTLESV